MAKFRSIKNSLIAGEISPTAHGRTDLPQYPHACKTLKNMIPLLSGGAYRRPGTFFETGLSAATYYAPRIIPFVVSQTEAYALVFVKTIAGTASVQVYRTTSNIATGTAGSVSGAHTYLAASVANAYSYDEWNEVQYIQSADILYLVHPRRKPMRIYRTATDTFSIQDYDVAFAGTDLREAIPYLDQNSAGGTLACSATAVGVGRTLTSSGNIFKSTHVGAYFKLNHSGTYGLVKVTAYTNPASVTCEVIVALGSTGTTSTWWESAWSDYRGWPRTMALQNGRLIYGGTTYMPDSAWCSQASNYDVMSVVSITAPKSSPTGDQPFTFSLSSQQLNELQWMVQGESLRMGTRGDEWIISTKDATVGFACGNLSSSRSTSYGSAYHQPAVFGNEIVFRLASDVEVRSLVFNQYQNAYTAESVQLLYDEYPRFDSHSSLLNRKYRQIVWDESRKTLWCLDTAGNLFGLTRDRNLQINSWHHHEMGGYDATQGSATVAVGASTSTDPNYTNTSGAVCSIAVIPNPKIGMNDLWIVVKRYVNSATSYHVERIIGGMCPFTTVYGANVPNVSGNYYVDAAAYGTNEYPGAEDYIFNGNTTHLEGKTLEGTAYLPTGFVSLHDITVNSGVANLPNAQLPSNFESVICTVALGLPFSGVVEAMQMEAGSQIGTAQAAKKRLHEVTPKFYRTLAAKIGRNADTLEQLIFRTGSTPMGSSPDLFTGDKTVKFNGDYDRDGIVYILADKPLPFALCSIVSEGVTYD